MNKPAFSARRRLGNVGEDIACQFLAQKGYRILARNYLQPWGEIDIVAERNGVVRFVEVKSVSADSADFSRENIRTPEELVTRQKLMKLARTGALYMVATGDGREYQIDVVGVIMDRKRRLARCRLFEQAIGEENV